MQKGKIVQILGPVVDVAFEEGALPAIRDALRVDNHGKQAVMEVAQHMGNRIVRAIMLNASEGLQKGMEVTATGGITYEDLDILAGLPLYAVICGRSIRNAENPAAEARRITARMQELWT